MYIPFWIASKAIHQATLVRLQPQKKYFDYLALAFIFLLFLFNLRILFFLH